MKEELINKAYEIAKERYATLGVDVDNVMEQLQQVSISMHCWQADDVLGSNRQVLDRRYPDHGQLSWQGSHDGRIATGYLESRFLYPRASTA